MPEAIALHVDLSDFAAQTAGMDVKARKAIQRRVRAALKDAGAGMVTEVRSRASWSSRIPAATSLKVTFSTTNAKAQISVSASKAPHARPYELGNKTTYDEGEIAARSGEERKVVNGRIVVTRKRRAAIKQMKATGTGVGHSLWHPVFGHKQPGAVEATRPFFFPAAAATSAAAQEAMSAVLDEVGKDIGFK